jgi:hypothetical protein
MTEPGCTPLGPHVTIAERERRPDWFADLLECMADLLVATRGQRLEIGRQNDGDDPRVGEAITRLTELERSLREVGVEAASVHHSLQQLHLI